MDEKEIKCQCCGDNPTNILCNLCLKVIERGTISQTKKALIEEIKDWAKDFPFECNCSNHPLADSCDRCKFNHRIDNLISQLEAKQ